MKTKQHICYICVGGRVYPMNALWLVVQVTSMGPGKLIIDISVMSLASLSPSILPSHLPQCSPSYALDLVFGCQPCPGKCLQSLYISTVMHPFNLLLLKYSLLPIIIFNSYFYCLVYLFAERICTS